MQGECTKVVVLAMCYSTTLFVTIALYNIVAEQNSYSLSQADSSLPSHETNHMTEHTLDHSSALEREREVARRYDDLFVFLQSHMKDTQVHWYMQLIFIV